MTTLLLVRHGATAANLRKPYTLQGLRPDAELAPEGQAQAAACARALRGTAITAVYSSPLKRAWATAEPIAAQFAVPLTPEPGLVEVDTGDWTGLTWQEIDRRWPAEAQAFRDDAEANGYLGGENLGQLRDRVLPVIDRLVARHPGETFLAVSHGVVIRVLLAHWLDLPLRFARRLPQENAAINHVTFGPAGVRVGTLNQVEPTAAA